MTPFYTLSDGEKRTALKWAREFYDQNVKHCRKLIAYAETDGYPPSGSDIFHPALWKGSHWKWFVRDGIPDLNDLGG